MTFLEDLKPGNVWRLGAHTFTAAEIKTFAARFDPQPFHMDEEAAARSLLGGLCASGWHTAGIWMRLMVENLRREAEAALARGEPAGQFGPSPGFRDLKWIKPVYAGDTITFSTEVMEVRPSNTRPDRGLLTALAKGVNQHGEDVITFVSLVFVQRRAA
jgi:acyl dehydratase